MGALPFTPWLLAAGIGSLCVGALQTFVHLFASAGGGVRTLFAALTKRPVSVLVIVVVDVLGGVGLALLGVVVGVSQPWLVRIVIENEFFGWFILGVFGPFVADRVFAGSIVRSRFEGWLTEAVDDEAVRGDDRALDAQLWTLRREAQFELQRKCWILVQRRLLDEARRLRVARDNAVDANNLDLLREIVSSCRHLRGTKRAGLPAEVIDGLDRLSSLGRQTRRGEMLSIAAFVEVLIETQTWDPLIVVFGDK